MRILLTGVAGFIGSHLAERLLASGHEVVGVDSFDETLYGKEVKRRNLSVLTGRKGFAFTEGDIVDAPLMERLAAGCDGVAHLAALAGVRPSIQQPLRYGRVNVEGTLSVLEACRKHGIARVAFASSSSVYGSRDAADVPFRESDPCLHPASPYAATKRAGELICSNYRDLHGIGIASLRFFTVYGPRQRPEMAIHKFTRLIAEGQPVPVFGNGETARDYTYVDDIIDGTYAATTTVAPGEFDILNLGGSKTTTLARLVELIGQELGITPKIDWLPEQPGDVPITFADVSHSHARLGYAPKVSIEEGVRRFVTWFRAQPRQA